MGLEGKSRYTVTPDSELYKHLSEEKLTEIYKKIKFAIWEQRYAQIKDEYPSNEMLSPTTELINELGYDSLDMIELLMRIEEVLDIELGDISQDWDTVNDVTNSVIKHILNSMN